VVFLETYSLGLENGSMKVLRHTEILNNIYGDYIYNK
jgi:hypothetical protein